MILSPAAAAPRSPAPSLLTGLTALSLALLGATLIAQTMDPRLLDGTPVWAKPIKFALSFTVFFATLAWVEARLSAPFRTGRAARATALVMATAFIAEMGWIVHQAARAEPSHYATEPFAAFIYYVVMAAGAVLLVAGLGVYGTLAARDAAAGFTPSMRRAVALGLWLSCVLTLVTAGVLSSGTSHFVGTPSPDAATLPLLGWSAEVGDLRPAHFLALHAMQALPLAALLAERLAPAGALRLVGIAAALWVALTAAVFAQALMGHPLIRL